MNLKSLSTVMSVSIYSIESSCYQHVNVNILQLSEPSDTEPINRDLIQCQYDDSVIGPVYKCVDEGKRPSKSELSSLGRKSKVLLHQFSKLKIYKGLLICETQTRKQLILPEKFHILVFVELHENLAHSGVVEELARKKCACVASKKPNVLHKAPLVPILASCPFEMVCIDFLKLDHCKGGFEYVLVVTDHFTRFSQAYATKTKSSKAAAMKMFSEYILQFGFPKRIHHDRGPKFNSRLFRELHRLAGIKASNTTPYHPMGDGQVEHLNRT